MKLLRAMASRLPRSVFRAKGDTATLVFEVDGCWLDARMREAPMIEIYVRTAELPGFSLRIEPNNVRYELPVKRHLTTDAYGQAGYAYDDAEVDVAVAGSRPRISLGSYDIKCSDLALQTLWLDGPACDALVEALSPVRSDSLLEAAAVARGYDYYVEHGEVLIRRRNELAVERLERAVIAGGLLAARPHRLAREWLERARALGGTTTGDRWEVGGEFAATFERGPATVRVDSVCVLPGEDHDDALLRTRVRARRVGGEGERWAIWRPSLARKHRPSSRGLDEVDQLPSPLAEFWKVEASAPARLRERLRGLHGLFVEASPTVLATVDDEVCLWWPGMVTDLGQLGPAVELVGRLAVELGGAIGPYR